MCLYNCWSLLMPMINDKSIVRRELYKHVYDLLKSPKNVIFLYCGSFFSYKCFSCNCLHKIHQWLAFNITDKIGTSYIPTFESCLYIYQVHIWWFCRNWFWKGFLALMSSFLMSHTEKESTLQKRKNCCIMT